MKKQLLKLIVGGSMLVLFGSERADAHPVCTNEYCHEGDCTYCEGDGQVPCPDPECTNGMITCFFCEGTGEQVCSGCGGDGGWWVWIDDGYWEDYGWWEDWGWDEYDEWGNSYWVEDWVWVEDLQWIDTSYEEWVVCDVCGGSGMEMCWECSGSGLLVCPVCGGDDSVSCPICDGTGRCQAFAGIQTTGPEWWFSRDVILTNSPPIDYGAVNQGQLKHIAAQAWAEMSNVFAYVTVSNIHALVQSFDVSVNDFAPANIGQVKYVAKPFYDVLINIQYTNHYPWTDSLSDDSDYHLANIGQVKRIFNFDLNFLGDFDGDGLPDLWELKYGLDRCSAIGMDGAAGDPDADDLNNLGEYVAGTSPLISDFDGDGLRDGFEVFYGFNPLVPGDELLDPEGDGLSNLEEQGYGTNPHSSDSDSDGMPDKWEIDNGLNPLVNDAAHDEEPDGLHNLGEFQNGTDPHDADTDNDNMPDGWEVEHGLLPTVDDSLGDADFDLVSNIDEYGLNTAPDCADTDHDGASDYEEIEIFGTNPLSVDFDGDGLTDGDEIYSDGSHGDTDGYSTKLKDADSDDDGLTDGEERDLGTNPLSPDTDGDGLSDRDEILSYETDPLSSDTDHDGFMDSLEIAGGTNPSGFSPDIDGDGNTDALTVIGPCEGDLNGDGLLSAADRALLVQLSENESVFTPAEFHQADLDGDGRVDQKDIALFDELQAGKPILIVKEPEQK